MITDPMGLRTTFHWLVEWACGHIETPIADRPPDACGLCGCTDVADRASYPIRVEAVPVGRLQEDK